MTWEIVAGDYGSNYMATVEGKDLSDCVARIYVWRDSTYLINGELCSAVTFADGDSSCYYTVKEGGIPANAAIGRRSTVYRVMIEFTKTGYKEHDLSFNWAVHPAPPE